MYDEGRGVMISLYISLVTILILLFFPLFPVAILGFLLLLSFLVSLYHYYNLSLLKSLRIPLLAVTFIAIYVFIGTWKGTLPSSTLFAALCFLKLFEIKQSRDVFSFVLILQLFVLSLSVQVEEFYYLVVIVAALFLSFFILFMNVGQNSSKKIIRNILGLILKASPIFILLLVLFPRYQFGGFFFSKNFAKTGFSETLVPGDVEKLINSKEELFHADISFPIQRDQLYWRGQVLSLNRAFSWTRGKSSDNYRYLDSPSLNKTYEVRFHEIWSGPLFTLDGTSKLTLFSKALLRKQRGGVYQATSVMDQKVRYKGEIGQVESLSTFKDFNKINLQVDQTISKKLRDFLDLHQSIKGDATKVSQLIGELFSKDFTYTLSPGTYSLESGFDEFFFERKRGFCGHFTTSSAILFRLFDIPARVVTGYLGGEYNEVGDFYLITQKDAHVWMEYIDESGVWKRFDPVSYIAPNRIEYESDIFYGNLTDSTRSIDFIKQSKNSFYRKWFQFVKSIYYKSGTLFFNYDLQYQRDILRKFKTYDLKGIFSYLGVGFFFFVTTLFCYKTNFIDLIMYLVLFKRKRISWQEFKFLELRQMREFEPLNMTLYQDFISSYEEIVYTRPIGVLYKLSFIFRGLKILIYEKSI